MMQRGSTINIYKDTPDPFTRNVCVAFSCTHSLLSELNVPLLYLSGLLIFGRSFTHCKLKASLAGHLTLFQRSRIVECKMNKYVHKEGVDSQVRPGR